MKVSATPGFNFARASCKAPSQHTLDRSLPEDSVPCGSYGMGMPYGRRSSHTLRMDHEELL